MEDHPPLSDGGRLVSASAQVAETQMSFYVDKNKQLLDSLPPSNSDPIDVLRRAVNKRGPIQAPVMELREITTLEMTNMLKKLGNSTSRANDELEAVMIKAAAVHLLKPLTFLVNLSIRNKDFSNHWKIGKLVPLFKGKNLDRLQPSSYRLVALLPVVGKLAERAI